MAAPVGGVSTDQKGKKQRKNKPTSKKYKHYTIEGDTLKKGKFCPRCGPGIFLATHSDRVYCGKCKYTEFVSSEKKENSTGVDSNKKEEKGADIDNKEKKE